MQIRRLLDLTGIAYSLCDSMCVIGASHMSPQWSPLLRLGELKPRIGWAIQECYYANVDPNKFQYFFQYFWTFSGPIRQTTGNIEVSHIQLKPVRYVADQLIDLILPIVLRH